MKTEPLTENEFEGCKLTALLKKGDDDTMVAILSWSYETYLLAREQLKKMEEVRAVICSIDPTHQITAYYDRCKVSHNLTTNEQKVIEINGDTEYECEDCLGRKKQVVIEEFDLDEFESLSEEASA